MRRRAFLAGLVAVPAVTYFDMGASWKRHGDLYLAEKSVWDGIDRAVAPPLLDKPMAPTMKELEQAMERLAAEFKKTAESPYRYVSPWYRLS